MKFKAKIRILEIANELINTIACGIARMKESTAMGGKPTVRCKLLVDAGFTITQSFLLLRNDNVR
ncbi:MAG: hypothetical protein IPL26_17845 [Leptospiraceae bacterium]|nr:hypothetical protein [Leptospiraceae bacterium]